MHLLDTNAISEIAKNPAGKIVRRLASSAEAKIATSIIVCCEIEFGLALKKSERLERQMRAILGDIEVLPFDEPAQLHYGRLRAELSRVGRPIGPNDMLIAAHALALDATLVTDNENEFSRVPGLRIENWLR